MENKNILYFTRTMGIGGTEKVVMQLCRYFNNKFNKIIVCSNGGIHEDELQKLGIKHYKIDDIEDKNPIIIFKTLISLYKIIKNENIDIVHTHHRMAAFYSEILNKLMNFKFIHTAHNTFHNKKTLTKFALNNAEIIAVGEKVKENLLELYELDTDKINVIYNGIEKYTGEISVVPEIKKFKDEGYFIVGNIGRLSKQKGMEYYIKAIPESIKKYQKIKFYIIGDGEDKLELIKLAKELGIENNVIFLGYRNDVINIIKQLDLIVLSSLWEGLPLTPIEAFSEGKTIIATDVDGTSEIVKDQYNGLLIVSKDSNEIAMNIIKIIDNKSLKDNLQKNAYKTYSQKFSIDIFNSSYEKYYRLI
ncbi:MULTISPECIES: glycosyltransferase family 4 protein [Clostridium]|uniref:glycosyltransferase family 4 protein n=1 Tax=Clostridium TaxID=1485 RepID=UPI001FA972EA|nr:MULTISPECIES: glycosyltransferase family 4 protein [Clostridium]MDU1069990.1 glycosyltransferase family 4 protein [Clostridium sp.]MDU2677706.1 glycosyltransferase family 4 protein [Clostridium sp.]MDU4213104.1 glycosyltransferase family 4 protein [Clostridium sp.]MDU5176242.1 glycosyltransferase family 4 protein [Clostridium sp.]MDU7120762.1 glycosyltransferase family 4 protein [Clostridium sp.]